MYHIARLTNNICLNIISFFPWACSVWHLYMIMAAKHLDWVFESVGLPWTYLNLWLRNNQKNSFWEIPL